MEEVLLRNVAQVKVGDVGGGEWVGGAWRGVEGQAALLQAAQTGNSGAQKASWQFGTLAPLRCGCPRDR